MLGLGLSTGTASVLILVLFLIFDAFQRDIYTNPDWLWLFPIIIFLWIGRIWLISQRGELNDDPVVFALKDRQSLVLGVLMVAATLFICIVSMMVWLHHFFTMGAGAAVNTFFGIASSVIAVGTGVKIYNWIFTMYGGRVRFERGGKL